MRIKLFGPITAANGAPSGATAGEPLRPGGVGADNLNAGWDATTDAGMIVFAMTGTGVLTVAYLRLWLYYEDIAQWVPAGSGDDANKGKLNADATVPFVLGETASDVVTHCERVYGIKVAQRVYLEAGALGGTVTAAYAYLLTSGGGDR